MNIKNYTSGMMKQAEFIEVFLPYVWDGKQTYFESMKIGGFKALAERNEP